MSASAEILHTDPSVLEMVARWKTDGDAPDLEEYDKPISDENWLDPGRVARRWFFFPSERKLRGLVYYFRNTEGPRAVVHGGCIATVLDVGMARCVNKVSNSERCVTANLSVNYKKPVPCESFVLLEAQLGDIPNVSREEQGSREDPGSAATELTYKYNTNCKVTSLDGTVLFNTGSALFVDLAAREKMHSSSGKGIAS
ncbi:unnamed protein product [Amoebophrya sp. A120]|nr:unnamed protein product [Amoebophrya sp. A120]|eukprot:GSA120T00020179001.1